MGVPKARIWSVGFIEMTNPGFALNPGEKSAPK
jgi:hypothetical protein